MKEIGWGRVDAVPGAASARWLGGLESFESFHWHGETFGIPPGAERIAHSPFCTNQMFALGKHLALQCHIEMTPSLIAAWCADWHRKIASPAQHTPSVQTPAQMLADVRGKTARLNRVADVIYGAWLDGMAR